MDILIPGSVALLVLTTLLVLFFRDLESLPKRLTDSLKVENTD